DGSHLSWALGYGGWLSQPCLGHTHPGMGRNRWNRKPELDANRLSHPGPARILVFNVKMFEGQ
ncbi:Hypothetical predicted protein, partial [Lynx pardinus]